MKVIKTAQNAVSAQTIFFEVVRFGTGVVITGMAMKLKELETLTDH